MQDELDEIENEKDQIETKLEKLENYSYQLFNPITYEIALGEIVVSNESGNLQLQQELDEIFELIQTKYL